MYKKHSEGFRILKQVVPAHALGCIQGALKNHVCGIFHTELAMGAEACLSGVALPPARLLGPPMGASATSNFGLI